MTLKTPVKFLKANRWFIIFAVVYSVYNVVEAIQINFESKIFLPFRYEGLLFFRNAIMNDFNAFFFIRDWSTSFLLEEHPLLYFHNLDLVHFFAGFIQYYLSNGKIILFVLSLMVSLLGLWVIVNHISRYYGKLVTVIFLALLLIPADAFRLSPQNLLITLSLFSVVWNVTLLRKIWNDTPLDPRFLLELFCAFLLAAIVETNLTVFLVMIAGLFALYSIKLPLTLQFFKKIFFIPVVSALPLVLLRLMQLGAVYFYGYMNEYVADINYTSSLKVNAKVDMFEATAFYAQHGLTFFGQGSPPKITTNLQILTNYYLSNYGGWIWGAIVTMSVLLLLIKSIGGNKIYKHVYREQFQNLAFLSVYILSFTIASYIILFLTGDAIIKVFLFEYGIIDLDAIYRAFFILLIPTVLWMFRNKLKFNAMTSNSLCIFVILATVFLFTYFAKSSILRTRKEYFGYKQVLSLIPEKSTIITNFEPSVVAIETKSRVNMSWFEGQPYSCDYLNSKLLLKMYKINKNKYENTNLYVFLALYPPYGNPEYREALIKRHCIKPETHQLLYEDKLQLLYKYNG